MEFSVPMNYSQICIISTILDLLKKDKWLETANEDGMPVLDVEPQIRLLLCL
jgi:hypothetical protein